MENKLPVRKNLRLREFDYNTPGAYFITFCTHNRSNTLSRIVGAIQESPVSQLTTCGVIVDAVIQSIPEHLHVTIDRYVIMPNHVHLIVVIAESDVLRAIRESPLQGWRFPADNAAMRLSFLYKDFGRGCGGTLFGKKVPPHHS